MPRIEIECIRKKLNEFSFSKVIDKEGYNGQSWNACEEFIHYNKSCCTLCEGTDCATPVGEEHNAFKLHYVSHGAHALDFCESMKIKVEDEWNDQPVLFLFENPSIQYDKLYGDPVYKSYDKCPAQKWYWLHDGYEKEMCLDYPKYYRQGRYAELVASLIKTFRLRNAYMTNFVKCAMNDADGKHYLGTAYYQTKCIETCFKHILLEEIKILTNCFSEKLIVFAFSQRVFDLAQEYLGKEEKMKDKYTICLMPHPASRLANDYRKYVIFGKVFKTLSNNGIECDAALKEFLENDKFDGVDAVNHSDIDGDTLKARFRQVKVPVETEDGQITQKQIQIKERRISGNGTGTVTVLPTEIKCKFKFEDRVFEFGFVFRADDPFWIWDAQKKCFLDKASEASATLEELFEIFHDFVSESMKQ